ncbi:hypothetical protein C440_04323 [Haloferax mucosum ATCC BAA-1512]|uniref:DUF1616 domain-containing protein n=1 Tax=Haloferax mucosum ATCC BAA-1512 TaxID=662479 RepID=M0ILS0_9EURY|nr:DUF1616 domain-containing protein [Haloferax mucosum]ELZ96972.1 hypothetical protein C440_04323 [Haloferax mucosum ATCC BAA-1512]
MAARSDWQLYLPEQIRTLPADLAAVFATVALTAIVALTPGLNETVLRDAIGLPFLLFVPGYTLVAALFPERGPTTDSPDDQRGIDGIERATLSFGTSIATVPLFGLVLNFTPWGLRLVPILVAIGGFTAVTAVVALIRRRALPEPERFAIPYEAWFETVRAELFAPDSKTDAVLNVVLVLSLVLATASVGYAVAGPKDGESFSELYLLTADGEDDLVADDYPETLVRGESAPLVVGVGNQEHRPVNYTVVVLLQRVETENNSTTVLESDQLETFSPRLEHNETWHRDHRIQPTMTGENLRLTYLLYRGQPPTSPSVENAYREVYLWLTVREQ